MSGQRHATDRSGYRDHRAGSRPRAIASSRSVASNCSTAGHTGRHFHRYLNPERDIDEARGRGARHHARAPRRARRSSPRSPLSCWRSSRAAELIIHNAAFDVAFLEHGAGAAGDGAVTAARSARCATCAGCSIRSRWRASAIPASATASMRSASATASTIRIASCTARCSMRALLADVYLAMTGGQSLLALEEATRAQSGRARWSGEAAPLERPEASHCGSSWPSRRSSPRTRRSRPLLQKASGGNCLWLRARAGRRVDGGDRRHARRVPRR